MFLLVGPPGVVRNNNNNIKQQLINAVYFVGPKSIEALRVKYRVLINAIIIIVGKLLLLKCARLFVPRPSELRGFLGGTIINSQSHDTHNIGNFPKQNKSVRTFRRGLRPLNPPPRSGICLRIRIIITQRREASFLVKRAVFGVITSSSHVRTVRRTAAPENDMALLQCAPHRARWLNTTVNSVSGGLVVGTQTVPRRLTHRVC